MTVTVTVDESVIDAESSDCTFLTSESGTGLRNEAALTTNGELSDTDACAPVAAVVVSKTVASVILGTDGVFTVTYDLDVTNTGSAATTYDLADAFAFGAGVTVVAGSVSVTAGVGAPTPDSGWDGVGTTTIVNDALISAGTTHAFSIVVQVTVDPATATNASSDCTLATSETGTGLRNAATLTVNGESAPAVACAPFPILTLSKTVVGVPVENGDGTWTIDYDVTLDNAGAADARYDLTDTLRLGTGVTVVSAGITTSSVGAGSPSATWDGTTDTTVVTGVTLAAASSHVYRVTATASIDEQAASAASSDCTLTGTETGTGFRNETEVTWDDRRDTSSGPLAPIGGPVGGPEADADACAPFPLISLAKALAGTPVENGDGTTTVSYDITVTNTGAGAGTYDLTDTLRFGTGVAIVAASAAVANTTPGSITTSATWDGVTDTTVVTDEPIAGSAAHVYRVTVTVTTDPATATTASSDCTLDTGETGTGFRNDSSLVTNGETLDADACAPFPALVITKSLVSAVLGTDGRYDLTYDLTVTNNGSGAASYGLSDELRFGTGVTIATGAEAPTVANTTPGSVVTNPAWDGVLDTAVVSNEAIAGDTSHVYRVAATVTVDTDTATTASSDCTLDTGETGTGFRNDTTLTTNGVSSDATDCAPFAIRS